MGHKIRPIGLRIGITETWRSRWYAGKADFGTWLVEDQKIRQAIKKQYSFAGISKIEIERSRNKVSVLVHVARPGLIIGRKGAEMEKLRGDLGRLVPKRDVDVTVIEVEKPESDAQLVSEAVAEQLLKRAAFRRVCKNAIDTAMNAGALGVRVQVGGRLGGAEIARSEHFGQGKLPLQTLRAKIDYGFAEALTNYGKIGVKVWIYKGQVMKADPVTPALVPVVAPDAAPVVTGEVV